MNNINRTNKSLLHVAIVLPVYNEEKYLSSCLDSLLNQTYHNICIYCIDDASTDTSASILKSYKENDSRIVIERHNLNKGAAASRNTGLRLAVKETHFENRYIYFMDADDTLSEDGINQMVETASQNHLDILYINSFYEPDSHSNYIDESKLNYNTQVIKGKVLSGRDMFINMMDAESYSGSPPRHFYRLGFLTKKGFSFNEQLRHGEDFPFANQAILEACRTMVLDKKLHHYRRHFGSLSTVDDAQKAKDLFLCWIDFMKLLQKYRKDHDVAYRLMKNCDNVFGYAKKFYESNFDTWSDHLIDDDYIFYLHQLLIQERNLKFIGKKISDDVKELIEDKKRIIVFGAGRTAIDVVYSLHKLNANITGIMVSADNKSTKFMGHPVKLIEDYMQQKDIPIVLAVQKSRFHEVRSLLEQKGFYNIFI